MIGLILAYAAAITSLAWRWRPGSPGWAASSPMSVMAYVLVAVGWPVLLEVLPHPPGLPDEPLRNRRRTGTDSRLASPFFGIYATTERASRMAVWLQFLLRLGSGPPLAHEDATWPLIWIGVYSAIALILAIATLRTFDRCLGRVPESRQA